MITVWKYPLAITREQQITIPERPKFLHVGLDPDGAPCLWCQVLTTNAPVELPVAIIGTGHPVPLNSTHRGSFVQGPFVWHVYTLFEGWING